MATSPSPRARRFALFALAVVAATAAGAGVGLALTPRAPPLARGLGTKAQARGPVRTPPLERLTVTSPYGPRVLHGRLGFHKGVDLRARVGTPLAAIAPGVVTRTHRTNKGGLSVVVQLDDGWRAGYAHLSRIDVKEGTRIATGARVGLSGDTGTEGAPHLHFELRDPKSHALIDPWPHLAGTATSSPWRARLPTLRIASVNVRDMERAARIAQARAWRTSAPLRHTIARALS